MNPDLLLPLVAFCAVSSITPGPNNLMLLASGVNYGFGRTVPHAAGVSLGFFIMLVVVGLGIGTLLTLYPAIYTVLKVASAAYLVYLAVRMATSRSLSGPDEGKGRPMTPLEAAAFQWINPKAWVMAVSGMAIYADKANPYWSSLLIATIFAVVGLPCLAVWAGFGTALRGFLADSTRLRWFNIAMSALMVASVAPMLLEH